MKSRPRLVGVRAVFFDLDDTLCAYWEAARSGLRKAFYLHAPARLDPDRLLEHWAEAFRDFYPRLKTEGWYGPYLERGEITRTELMRRALLLAGIEDAVLARALSETYATERLRALRLFPGARELLESLRGSYFLGLITNGPADVQRDEIEVLDIGRLFDTILIEGELGFGKPDPEVFRRAEQACQKEGREILFVGNSYAHDVLPALEAGWRAVWIRREDDVPPSTAGVAVSPEEIAEHAPQPDAILPSLAELRELLLEVG